MKKIIAAAALAAISATASASANLLTDGSFEDITQVGANSWSIVSQKTLTADETKSGWTVSAAPTTKGPVAGLEVRDGVAGTAQDGAHFIELDGNENDQISQSFKTVSGHDYEISFYVQDRPDVTTKFLTKSGGYGYKIVSGAETLKSSSAGAFGTDWTLETITFTADSNKTTFSIYGAGTSDSYGTSFDNFSAVAVPEPATLGLFAAGLAMLGLSSRRRNRK